MIGLIILIPLCLICIIIGIFWRLRKDKQNLIKDHNFKYGEVQVTKEIKDFLMKKNYYSLKNFLKKRNKI